MSRVLWTQSRGSISSTVNELFYAVYDMFTKYLRLLYACQELKLCQNAVLLLAFLASSGKFGFEILVNHKLLQDANFLMLILQVLAAVDAETTVNPKQPQLYKER